MRRIALVLTVAMLMAMMMLSAGPAKADVFNSDGDFENQQLVVIVDGGHWSGGDGWHGGGCCWGGWGDIDVSGFDIDFS